MQMLGPLGDGAEYPTLPMETHPMDLMDLCGAHMETLPMEAGDPRMVALLAQHTAIPFIVIK